MPVEIWAEKSTVNDVLIPLASRYGLNVQTSLGEISTTRCRELVARAARNGDRPVRILYVSDFDPAGQSMPVATARKIEWLIREGGYDIQLHPIVLTHEQCVAYQLPRTPIKETELRAAGFERRYGAGATELDALEALRPGELRRILVREIERFHDPRFSSRWHNAKSEAQADLDKITREILDRHADADSTLLRRLEELRAQAAGLDADLRARNEAIQRALRSASRSVLDDLEMPEPRPADEWENPLFDSSRDYVAQIDRYKAHQGKETERRPGRQHNAPIREAGQ